MSEIDFRESLEMLKSNFNFNLKQTPSFSFGTPEFCKKILIEAMKNVDKTKDNFQFLEEYELVAKYLSNTNHKGLLLAGDVGRGKSIIVEKILPLLFLHYQKKVLKVFHANDLGRNIQELKKCKLFAIDEVGGESLFNDFGVQKEAFIEIVDAAERNDSIIFITTNLTFDALLTRYGERTMDRLKRLTTPIKFKGPSLRE